MEGWIKLYRKSKDNPLMKDFKAWTIFSWILLTVNRLSGEMTLGRFWASEYFKLPPTTFYGVLKRLEKKYKVITQSTNNKFTTISVLNWAKYQERNLKPTQQTDNKPTTNRQQTDTLQEVENIRIREGRHPSINYLLNLPSNDLAEFTLAFICTDRQVINKAQSLYDYCQSRGKHYKDYKAFLRNALRKDFGDRPPAIDYVPKTEEISEEQRLKNIERIASIKSKLKLKEFN